MSTVSIPYMNVPGTLTKILEKIKEAGTPDNFNYDFLETKLGFKGGNYRTFISWAKKLGLINSDGTPTQLYKKFRSPSSSKLALAEAMRKGYQELYSRNEYCHELDKAKFKGLVMEATGQPHDSKTVEYIVNCFFNAKTMADFDSRESQKEDPKVDVGEKLDDIPKNNGQSNGRVSLGLNYTINLVLPKTDDPAVYNAIFKSLRENILKD